MTFLGLKPYNRRKLASTLAIASVASFAFFLFVAAPGGSVFLERISLAVFSLSFFVLLVLRFVGLIQFLAGISGNGEDK